jgi:hypothetical protein
MVIRHGESQKPNFIQMVDFWQLAGNLILLCIIFYSNIQNFCALLIEATTILGAYGIL